MPDAEKDLRLTMRITCFAQAVCQFFKRGKGAVERPGPLLLPRERKRAKVTSRLIYGGKGPPSAAEVRLRATKVGVRGTNENGCLRPESGPLTPLYRQKSAGRSPAAEIESLSWSILGASAFLKVAHIAAFQTK